MIGRIFKALSGFYYIKSENEIYQTRARGQFRKQKTSPLVGDIVEFESSNPKEGIITKIIERKNELHRPNVANVDQVIVVTSAIEPNFSTLLLDRFIAAVELLNIEPILYFSKLDLLTEDEQKELLNYQQQYQSIGYEVVNNFEKEELFNLLADKLTVVMGQSGAGKSTLLNELLGKKELAVGEISKALGRGRHTTRHIELVEVAGGLLADTPGFSSLDLQMTEASVLKSCFIEFNGYSSNCKFRECLHHKEPKCAVKAAVEAEEIAKFRYDDYLELLDEIQEKKYY